jgi:hypothetical protein
MRRDQFRDKFSHLEQQEMERKWRVFHEARMMEELNEAAMSSRSYSSASLMQTGGGIIQPEANTFPSNCIEFVNNTTDGTYSEFYITTSGPTNFTINWGDGETFTDFVDGNYTVSHTYADSDQEYTCRLCFDDASVVTGLDFLGDD